LALHQTLGELHTTQKQLIVAKDDALQASQSKSRFLANMSHEIRTPMNAILGFTELLKGRLTEKKNKSFLESIDISGRSLLRLINDILDLSKVEAGKFELEYTAVNPHNLFKEIHSIFSRKISQKGLNFIMDVDKKLPKALILDETRLRQILFNLIGNAIKFTKEGYVKLSVRHQENLNDQSHLTLCFSIEDTGVGIPIENRTKIFEAFEQQKGQSHAEFGGTGLGLAISKRLAQLMNGDITIIDGSEGGVIFQVTLNDIEVAVNAPDAIDTEKPTDIISFDNAKILIADDVPLNRELLANYLAGYSFTIMQAENGLECVTLVKKNPPDLILMDMKMPVMDGFEATAIIKGDEATKHIPIIAVTASAMKQSEEEIRNVCDSYLRKPLSRMALIQEISHFLKHTKASSILPENKEESVPRKQHSSAILQKLQDMVLPSVLKYLDNPGTSELNEVIITLRKLSPEEYSEAHALAQELEEALDNFDIEYIESTLKKLKEDIS
ncbi:MAG: response regulator, partial [Lentisphaeraceae bacterium]|nr:response regulator [Lentisphaeraceae bacterium]